MGHATTAAGRLPGERALRHRGRAAGHGLQAWTGAGKPGEGGVASDFQIVPFRTPGFRPFLPFCTRLEHRNHHLSLNPTSTKLHIRIPGKNLLSPKLSQSVPHSCRPLEPHISWMKSLAQPVLGCARALLRSAAFSRCFRWGRSFCNRELILLPHGMVRMPSTVLCTTCTAASVVVVCAEATGSGATDAQRTLRTWRLGRLNGEM